MKHNIYINLIAIFVITILAYSLVSCKTNNEQTETTELDSLVIIEEIPFSKDYTFYSFAYKDEVVADAKQELINMEQEISLLKEEIDNLADTLTDDAKSSYADILEIARTNCDEYKTKLSELEKSTSQTWDNVKTDMANAYNTVFQDIENINEKMKGKIEGTPDGITNELDSLAKTQANS